MRTRGPNELGQSGWVTGTLTVFAQCPLRSMISCSVSTMRSGRSVRSIGNTGEPFLCCKVYILARVYACGEMRAAWRRCVVERRVNDDDSMYGEFIVIQNSE